MSIDYGNYQPQIDPATGFTTISLAQLALIMPAAGTRCVKFLGPLNQTMHEFGIHSAARKRAFLAQIAHESGQLRYTAEIASGVRYEGRKDLGNTQPGDGVRFKGRGLIQVTGRANYTACMLALDIDCVEHPELLEQPLNAARSAGWFWQTHGLNQLADLGDQIKVTKRINGGTNGLPDRLAFFENARKVIV
jgi:putative chitinase